MTRTGGPLEMLVATLAAARLTRLVTTDSLTQGLRDRITQRTHTEAAWHAQHARDLRRYGRDVADAGGPIVYLINCSWCSGVWITAALFGAAHLAPVRSAPILRALAASYVVGWLSERE